MARVLYDSDALIDHLQGRRALPAGRAHLTRSWGTQTVTSCV
jgi:hypothetical protein